mmetsp:Transcript_3631/g.12648  ORF Transcript_3631/g.12648 Transcript_3631/m.12648 type:complete len:296 (+) Transcript_3631:124-1011(+)
MRTSKSSSPSATRTASRCASPQFTSVRIQRVTSSAELSSGMTTSASSLASPPSPASPPSAVASASVSGSAAACTPSPPCAGASAGASFAAVAAATISTSAPTEGLSPLALAAAISSASCTVCAASQARLSSLRSVHHSAAVAMHAVMMSSFSSSIIRMPISTSSCSSSMIVMRYMTPAAATRHSPCFASGSLAGTSSPATMHWSIFSRTMARRKGPVMHPSPLMVKSCPARYAAAARMCARIQPGSSSPFLALYTTCLIAESGPSSSCGRSMSTWALDWIRVIAQKVPAMQRSSL